MIHPAILKSAGSRLFGIIQNPTLIAVPLFVFMGGMLEKAKIADKLLSGIAAMMGDKPAGLAIAVVIVGALLAASTGIVGATVVTMGMISLPVMLKKGYSAEVSTGVICASGTLGQIIPPSIVLVLLGDVIASANRDVGSGNSPVSVGDLFAGAIIPGFLLVLMYITYLVFYSRYNPGAFKHNATPDIAATSRLLPTQEAPAEKISLGMILSPILLILLVLGSILKGIATPTEAAALGATGAIILAILAKEFDMQRLKEVMRSTTKTSSMVFMILVGASIFSLVFRAFHGDRTIEQMLSDLPGGLTTAMLLVMLTMFLLGFILDFIEIIFVVVPLTAPALIALGADPIWLGVLIAINLQTSFLTPPFGFSLFYLRSVAPKSIQTKQIYKGVLPFIAIQLLLILIIWQFPSMATWLPHLLYD
ncbi:MAG: TRAP transporter large permease subunit [Enterobacterales bacterium]|nr:TRAP transporter large permease subunit [Enterobacterales bacterium]